MPHDFKDFGLSMMPWGTDPETGYPLYLLKLQRFAVVLPRCEGCGDTNVLSAPLGKWPSGTQLCYDCLLKYQRAQSQCSRLDGWSSYKTLCSFKDKVAWYCERQADGYWVPPTLGKYQQKILSVEPDIMAREARKQEIAGQIKMKQFNKTNYCDYCGHKGSVKIVGEATNRYICPGCFDRRNRYQSLIKRFDNLTEEELIELSGILDEYALHMKKGYLTPDIPRMRKRINEKGPS